MVEQHEDIALPPEHRSGFVAVVGRPSVGKSTLVNRFVGQKVAIVSHRPQTTRNRILGVLTRDLSQIVFIDTPGYHKPQTKLGEYMVDTVRKAVPDADVVLFVVDGSVPPGPEDVWVAERLLKTCRAPVLLVMNKMDRLAAEDIQAHVDGYQKLGSFADWMMVSAAHGANLDKLEAMIVPRLPLGPRYYPPGQVTDVSLRFHSAELIREQAFRLLQQELPHGIAVTVEEFAEREGGVTYIAATIHVEKASHKGIVIGKGGAMIKNIGVAARAEIERELESKAFLDLHVQIDVKWRRDNAALQELGYGE
jgi:GTPase